MEVPGIIVARTDAEAANLLENKSDERDHPFILGATNLDVPSYKNCYLAILKRINSKGVKEINGHLLYKISDATYRKTNQWLKDNGIFDIIDKSAKGLKSKETATFESAFNSIVDNFVEIWEAASGLTTIGEAVADIMEFNLEQGSKFDMTVAQWKEFAKTASINEAKEKAKDLGISLNWDCELSSTPGGLLPGKGRYRNTRLPSHLLLHRSAMYFGWRRRLLILRMPRNLQMQFTRYTRTRCLLTIYHLHLTGIQQV